MTPPNSFAPTYPWLHNPAQLDTTLPATRVKMTAWQADELIQRLIVTAEEDELESWGWVEQTGATNYYLHVVYDLAHHALGEMGDIMSAAPWRHPDRDHQATRSLESLHDKVAAAVEMKVGDALDQLEGRIALRGYRRAQARKARR